MKRQFYAPHTRTHTRLKKKYTSTQSSNKLRYVKPRSPTFFSFLFILIPQSSSFNFGAPGKVLVKKVEYKSRPAGHTPTARSAHQQTREKRTLSQVTSRDPIRKKKCSKNESTEGMIREETSTCQRVTDLAASPSRSSRPRVIPLWAGAVRPTPRSAQLPPSAAVFKDGRPAERGKKNLGQTFLSCVFLAFGEAIHVSACPMS